MKSIHRIRFTIQNQVLVDGTIEALAAAMGIADRDHHELRVSIDLPKIIPASMRAVGPVILELFAREKAHCAQCCENPECETCHSEEPPNGHIIEAQERFARRRAEAVEESCASRRKKPCASHNADCEIPCEAEEREYPEAAETAWAEGNCPACGTPNKTHYGGACPKARPVPE